MLQPRVWEGGPASARAGVGSAASERAGRGPPEAPYTGLHGLRLSHAADVLPRGAQPPPGAGEVHTYYPSGWIARSSQAIISPQRLVTFEIAVGRYPVFDFIPHSFFEPTSYRIGVK